MGAEGGEVPLLYLACSPRRWSAQVGRYTGDGTDQLGEHQWGPEVSGAGMRRQLTWAGIPPHPHTPHGYTPSARLLSARADRSECPEYCYNDELCARRDRNEGNADMGLCGDTMLLYLRLLCTSVRLV
ncbi:hypothetical protein MHYP_G00213550 [Metynnis hypsauchen]